MNKEQKDILNRVKLFMNYDNKKTLSENYQSILNEQPTASVMDRQNYPIQAALWLNNNLDSSETKTYLDTYKNYLLSIKDLPLQNLLNISKQLAENGYGPISPGLYGFNKPNAGVANLPLENQIFILKNKEYQKLKSEYDKNPSNKLIPQKPEPPQYNLLNLIVNSKSAILMGKRTNIPKQILEKNDAQKQQSVLPDTPFKNKEESDRFRAWLLTSYPEYEKKPKPYNVQLISNSINSEALKKAYKEKGKEYEKQKTDIKKIENDLRYNPEPISSDATKTDAKIFGGMDPNKYIENLEKQSKKVEKEKEQQKKYDDWVDSQFDFSTFPEAKEKWNYNTGEFEIIYDQDEWIEPKTKIKINIKGKTKEQVKQELKTEHIGVKEVKQQEKEEQDLLNNDLLIKIFGKDRITQEIENKECDFDKKLEFFRNVLRRTGYYNENGKTIGMYYKNTNGVSEFIKWPQNRKIPCVDVWWDKYGMAVQLGGMLAVSILTGGMGTIGFIIELLLDAGLNVYSLKKNSEAQDEDAMALDFAYLILPFAMMSGPVKAILKNMKFDKNVLKSVENKISSLGKFAQPDDVKRVIDAMSEQEKRVIKELSNEEYKSVLKKVGEDYINNLKGKGSIARKISNPLVNIFVYGTPIAAYFTLTKTIEEKIGRSLSDEENLVWQKTMELLDEPSKDILENWITNQATKEQLTSIMESDSFKTAAINSQNPKNLSKEELKKQLKPLNNIIEQAKQYQLKLKTEENLEDEFFKALDEYEGTNTEK